MKIPATDGRTSDHQINYQIFLENLRLEIEKGWGGQTSSRSLEDLISSKLAKSH